MDRPSSGWPTESYKSLFAFAYFGVAIGINPSRLNPRLVPRAPALTILLLASLNVTPASVLCAMRPLCWLAHPQTNIIARTLKSFLGTMDTSVDLRRTG